MVSKSISAAPGNPSTFWSADEKHWYTSKADALKGDISNAVNPDDYVLHKSFWAQNKKNIIAAVVILALVIGGFYLYKKGVIVFRLNK